MSAPPAGASLLERSDDNAGQQVRIGLVLSGQAAAWQRVIIDRLRWTPTVSVAMLVEQPRSDAGGWRPAPWRLVNRLDTRIARVLFARIAARCSVIPESLDGRPVPVAMLDGLSHLRLLSLDDEARRQAVRAADLDVLIDLNGGTWTGEDSCLARHGIWSLRTDHGGYDACTPLGFREFYRNAPICAIRLMRSDGTAVTSGHYGTYRWSWTVNAVLLAHKASFLVTDALERLGREQDDVDAHGHDDRLDVPRPGPHPPLREALAAPFIGGARMMVEAARRRLLDACWRVVLVEATPQGPSPGQPIVFEPPAHCYWADPFVAVRDGRCCIFFEEYLYAERRGVISCVEVGARGQHRPGGPARARRVLDRPAHLSYPFLFSHNDGLYMIPESSRSRTVELWKCVRFPDVWEKQRNLLDNVSAADTTLLYSDGRWWMFTNIDRSGLLDHSSELHLFHTADPVQGRWLAHARNPVVVDARRARMAGGFLAASDGRPVRCCQVQGLRYGESVAFSLVETLSTTAYAERPIDGFACLPTQESSRHHHVAYADGFIVADECRDRSKLRRWLGRRTGARSMPAVPGTRQVGLLR